MKLKYIIYFIELFSFSVYSHTGLIVGLEAPLLQYPNIKSKVLQILRKGQKLYIAPDPRIKISPLKITYNVGQFGKQVIYKFDKELKFFHTLTKNGTDAFIPIDDVKLIHGDVREFENKIIRSDQDPRDYRLEEPLPQNYPFSKYKYKRLSLSYTSSNIGQPNYNYVNTVTQEKSQLQTGVQVIWGNKVSFDTADRFYFGGIFNFGTSTHVFKLGSFIDSTEKKREFSLGPYASYDIFRSEKFLVTLGCGIIYNYHLNLVALENLDNGSAESRQFSGSSLSGHLSSQFIIRDIIPTTNTDLIVGLNSSLYTPYKLTATTPIENDELWNEEDDIIAPISSKISLTIGFQARY